MEYKTLLKADLRKHKGSLAGIFLLIFLVSAALSTVVSVWLNSEQYIRSELSRAGFGTLTAWVSGVPDLSAFTEELTSQEAVERTETQPFIFANYTANGQDSDSEGQLIVFQGEDDRYHFFSDNLSSYQETVPQINQGEIYVSPSMVSMFGVQIGDTVSFPVVRAGVTADFTVQGFYEDPFMGSSMIGMKGFLISESDYETLQKQIRESGIDALARDGAMVHIFQKINGDSARTVSEFNTLLNEQTSLPRYAEFVHSENAIAGFMLILQNAFCGLLAAFVAVLLAVVMIVLGHTISSAVEAGYVNMGILKTIGFTGKKLRRIQMMQYLTVILTGQILGLFSSIIFSEMVSRMTLTTTGIRIPPQLPLGWCLLVFAVMFLVLTALIAYKTGRINQISPMKAIRGEAVETDGVRKVRFPIRGNLLKTSLAFRQLTAGKRRYLGAFMVAMLLVFFASLIGRMDSWLGADGQGMMYAFNPADHDIGVQVLGVYTSEEAEELVRSYTEITDSYLLAMPGISVDGVDYTANVITDPERFHIMEGRTSRNDDEIVLTEFVAADLGVSIGDTVTVQADSGSAGYTVSGIYTCANDMGDNVGMSREGYLKIGSDDPAIWCYHYFLEDASKKADITQALDAAFGGDVHVHENTWPGLYGIINAMQALLLFLYGMVVLFILVVTVLTGSKILSSEKRDIGIYKAIGFDSAQLRGSFSLRFGITALLGGVIGAGLAAVFTDPIVSGIMKMAGISSFASVPTVGNTLFPAVIVILLFMGFAYGASRNVKKVDLTVFITE
ncbi:MAG: FtsX-like permease family protein [Clostridiaceae bacterium]|nr:FtsX-like permease family protein [Clostridiaceae bacterium]